MKRFTTMHHTMTHRNDAFIQAVLLQNLQQYNMLPRNCSVRKWIYQHDFMTVNLSSNIEHLIKALAIVSHSI